MATLTITNTIAKCFKNKATWRTMNWWKTSFNMPVPKIFEKKSIYTETEWQLDAQWAWTSFDLSWFQLWWEAIAWNSVATVHWPFGWWEILISQRWKHPDWSTMFSNDAYVDLDPVANKESWTLAQIVSNQWVTEWEINQNGTYKLITTVTWAITWARTTNITITWCPAMWEYEPWYMWVEWNDLRWVSANWHLHRMYWELYASLWASPWYIWVQWEHLIWTWSDGNAYRPKYNFKQFASIFSNWANWSVSWKQPWYLWMDNEFWFEHISYISEFGDKWLCNSWANPYYFWSEP